MTSFTFIPVVIRLLILLLLPVIVTASSTTLSFSFDKKMQQLVKNFTFNGNSSASQSALQITPLAVDKSFLINQTGNIFLAKPFVVSKSIADGSKLVASFSTTFLLTFQRLRRTIKGGEGLAFVIMSRGDRDPPPGSYGGYFGLVNTSTDGQTSNGFAAVEFDVVKQDYDLDDNHIGLDVNGVHSVCATSLTPFGIHLNDGREVSYLVQIEYNGTSRNLSVYMAVDNGSKPNIVLQSAMDLSKILLGNTAYFGFSASTGVQYQFNSVSSWNLTVEQLDDRSRKTGSSRWKLGLAVGLPCVVTMLALGILCSVLISVWKKKNNKVGAAIDLRGIPGIPKEFKYTELKDGTKRAHACFEREDGTKNFDESMRLGQGGFGVVYRATVSGEHGRTTDVAVKRFSATNSKGQADFLAELQIINRLRHRNLVKLLGWCYHREALLLVYELMPNGSLDKFIFGSDGGRFLSWPQRYNVVLGVASAINYLHHEFGQKVIHRDIKPPNILLDAALNAQLGDFGLARALDDSKVDTISIGGTRRYIAPECYKTERATTQSDVYGFGVVVLEVVCGQPIASVLEQLWTLYGAGHGRVLEAVDARLAGQFDSNEAERLLLLGLACVHPSPEERPGTQSILHILTSSDAPPHIPPSSEYPASLAYHRSTDNTPISSISSGSMLTSSTSFVIV